jgi:hypothetical protein
VFNSTPHGTTHASTLTSQILTPFNDLCEVVTFGVEQYEHWEILLDDFMNFMVKHNMLTIDRRQLNNENFGKILKIIVLIERQKNHERKLFKLHT